MSDNRPSLEQLTHLELNTHLVNELHVSPDVEIAPFLACAIATTWGLAEKNSSVGIILPGRAEEEYEDLRASGPLPPHLQEKKAFVRRYGELVGNNPDETRDGRLPLPLRKTVTFLTQTSSAVSKSASANSSLLS